MKSKKPTRACNCFTTIPAAIEKAGHLDPQFEAVDVGLNLNTTGNPKKGTKR